MAWLLACDAHVEAPAAHPAGARAGYSLLVRCENACLHGLDRDDDAGWSACQQRCRADVAHRAPDAADRRGQDDESASRAPPEDQASVRAAVEHAAFLASCSVDRAERRQRRAERETASADAVMGRRGEERRLYAYQAEHCQRELEQKIESEPCDDGSGVVRACQSVVTEQVVYVCPGSAPEAIRGKHPGATTRADQGANGVGRDPGRMGRLASEDVASAGDPSADARDEVCRQADLEAEDTDAGVAAESDDGGRQRAGN